MEHLPSFEFSVEYPEHQEVAGEHRFYFADGSYDVVSHWEWQAVERELSYSNITDSDQVAWQFEKRLAK